MNHRVTQTHNRITPTTSVPEGVGDGIGSSRVAKAGTYHTEQPRTKTDLLTESRQSVEFLQNFDKHSCSNANPLYHSTNILQKFFKELHMGWSLSRSDYEELMFGVTENSKSPSDIAGGRRYIDRQYPTSTPAAAYEMRSRGLDAYPHKLDYLIKKGVLRAPTGGTGRNRQWTPEDIDLACDYFDRVGEIIPSAIMRMMLNLDAAQDIRAQHQAFNENPDVGRDASLLVMEILPGAPGVGLYATSCYRRMTPSEEQELRDRIKADKS